jgi:hypothetical protein
MSQWDHSPWNMESPEAAPAWPVAIAAQPAKREAAGGRCWKSCVEDFSFNWVLGVQVTYDRSTRVTWAHQDWVIPFFTASVSYHATELLVSTGLCVIWAWISLSRTGQASRCDAQAALVSASNPDHVISGYGSSGLAREKVTWRQCTGTCWSDIISSLVFRVN